MTPFPRSLAVPKGFARMNGSTDRTEPACWSWRPPDDDDIEEARLDDYAPAGGYEYGSWRHGLNVLLRFCRDRCTICGEGGQEQHRVLQMDHDHESGLCRGVLCARCNQREGYSHDVLFDNYRLLPPAAICGARVEWQPSLGPWPMPDLADFWRDLSLHDPGSPGWATREGRAWTAPEAALLRRDDLSDQELTAMLGRSLPAVARKRRSIGAALWLPSQPPKTADPRQLESAS